MLYAVYHITYKLSILHILNILTFLIFLFGLNVFILNNQQAFAYMWPHVFLQQFYLVLYFKIIATTFDVELYIITNVIVLIYCHCH